MEIRTLFFAIYRERVGREGMSISVSSGATVAELVRALRARGSPFDALPEAPAVAVNRTYAPLDTVLAEGDEVAFIPPVAGG